MAETVDMIAGRERGHTTSYLLDRAGHVSPGDQESRLPNAADTGGSHQHGFAANEMPVPRVRTAGPYPHQHLRLTDGRRVDLDEPEHVLGSAVLTLDDRLHHPSLQDPGQLAQPKAIGGWPSTASRSRRRYRPGATGWRFRVAARRSVFRDANGPQRRDSRRPCA